MAHIFSDDEFHDFLERSWDALCKLAYDQFLDVGRGFIGVDRAPGGEDYEMMFVKLGADSALGSDLTTLVDKYDPETEIVLFFASGENEHRTVRLRCRDKRGPKAIWEKCVLKDMIAGKKNGPVPETP